jgi:hypothetical protein
MLCRDEVNNQLEDIIVALILEVALRFHRHKMGHHLQYSHIGAIVHFFIRGDNEPIAILHLQWWLLISRP